MPQPRRKKIPSAPRSKSCSPSLRGTRCPLRTTLLPGRAPRLEGPTLWAVFTETRLFPKAWLQCQLLRDALPVPIHAPVNLAAGQVQGHPLSSALTSGSRGQGSPTLHAPQGSAHARGPEPLGGLRPALQVDGASVTGASQGSQRCQLPSPGPSNESAPRRRCHFYPSQKQPAQPGLLPLRPAWPASSAAASSKLSCAASASVSLFMFRFAEAPLGLALLCAPRASQGLSPQQ